MKLPGKNELRALVRLTRYKEYLAFVVVTSLLGAAAVTGWICLGTGFLYSWKKIRLKSIPVLDILSHGFMLAGLQFLAAVYAFSPERVSGWWTLLIFVSAISMYGQ